MWIKLSATSRSLAMPLLLVVVCSALVLGTHAQYRQGSTYWARPPANGVATPPYGAYYTVSDNQPRVVYGGSLGIDIVTGLLTFFIVAGIIIGVFWCCCLGCCCGPAANKEHRRRHRRSRQQEESCSDSD